MTTVTSASGSDAPKQGESAGGLAIGSWMMFDWAAQPFYTLVTTFLFAPYFSAYFIGDAAKARRSGVMPWLSRPFWSPSAARCLVQSRTCAGG
ncbi:MAG: hypothetical protein HC850_08155 [Rhodomicrobium sp.]|nr:hypothetical protein [Rhodomicrobium sp.]